MTGSSQTCFEELPSAAPVLPLPGEVDDLISSAPARPAIRVGPPRRARRRCLRTGAISLPWCPVPTTSATLAKVMDSLILISASLMFFCTFVAVTPGDSSVATDRAGRDRACGFFTSVYLYLGAWLGCGNTRSATG